MHARPFAARPPWRHRTIPAIGLVAALALVAVSCGSGGGTSASTTTVHRPSTSTTVAGSVASRKPCGAARTPPKTYEHVVLLVEENRTWTGGRTPAVGMGFDATEMPYLHGLAAGCTYFSNWAETDGTQNSLNQYIGLTSGVSNDATVNDCTPSIACRSTDDNIFRQVRTSGGTARTFVDGATEPCSAGTNAAKHIPALYYQGGHDAAACRTEVRPMADLDPNALPTFAMIVPDLCNDGHDCPNTTVDSWARQELGPILAGADYRAGRTLVAIVYDEDQPVPNLLIAPTAHAGVIDDITGTHAALLKTMEQALGLPVLRQGQLPTAISLRKPANL